MKVADFVANKTRAATTARRRCMSERKNDEIRKVEVGRGSFSSIWNSGAYESSAFRAGDSQKIVGSLQR